jgi:hypothetical protein
LIASVVPGVEPSRRVTVEHPVNAVTVLKTMIRLAKPGADDMRSPL